MVDSRFLEDIFAPDALEWAQKWSQKTIAHFDTTPKRMDLERRILAALDTDEKIPYVTRRGELLFNFWRDASHPRGLWRTTSLASFSSNAPEWDILIDLDELAADEQESWVWKGVEICPGSYDRALVKLSQGGGDAVVVREFDLPSKQFVTKDSFSVGGAKTDVSWVDRETILIGTDLGEGSLTTSGYPGQVLRWSRGQALSDAPIFFSGHAEDVSVGAWHDHTPNFERTFVMRAIDFYNSLVFVETEAGLQILEKPSDCQVFAVKQWLFCYPRTDFAGIKAGALGVIKFDSFLAGDRNFQPVFVPPSGSSIAGFSITKSNLVVQVLDNVSTSILVVDLSNPLGPLDQLLLPEHVTAWVIATSALDGDEAWITTASYSSPGALCRADFSSSLEPTLVKQSPLQWNNTGVETRQHTARSADGTLIPYFISGDFSSTGPKPTLVHAYGGFEVSLTPSHSAVRGMCWLEKDRYFVEANLRGGGEFGPQWHSQAVQENRQKVFDDHLAVLKDLVARGYTTEPLIAIRGASNGGLLTAVALTQYPEAFGAAVVQVPLTDMLRYHTWSAGASWMAEYGNPDDPELREILKSYSPLHNIVPSSTLQYPPALVTTSTRDDRVHPAHARLFADALKQAGQPVDYWENIEGGHAGAADNAQSAKAESLIYCWIEEALGISAAS